MKDKSGDKGVIVTMCLGRSHMSVHGPMSLESGLGLLAKNP
jgi:hypothetical protein